MSVGVAAVPEIAVPVDPLRDRLDGMLSVLAEAVAGCADLRNVGGVSDAARIDRITRLEQLKAAAAALQAAESVRFAQSQVAQQITADVHPKVIGRGIADQLALACKVSPYEGSRRLGTARALWFDLPETFRLLTRGRISEYVACLVVSETRHLDAQTRRRVDTTIVAAGIDRMGPRRAAACARTYAYAADPHGYLQRGRTERRYRRGRSAAGAGHHGRTDRLPARRTRRRLPSRTPPTHRHRARSGGSSQSRPDHGRHPGGAGHRPGRRRRREHRTARAHATDQPAGSSRRHAGRDCRIRPDPRRHRPH